MPQGHRSITPSHFLVEAQHQQCSFTTVLDGSLFSSRNVIKPSRLSELKTIDTFLVHKFRMRKVYLTLKQFQNKRRIVIVLLFSMITICSLLLFLSICVEWITFSISRFKVNQHQMKVDEHFTSFCSSEADHRGPHQNVVALSLYGNFSHPAHFARYVDPSLKFILRNFTRNYPGYSYLLSRPF